MKTFKNTAKITVKNAREEENGTISFAEPLAITDDSRQWNNTRYDIASLDINQYDGTVTADHGQKLSDVIGKVTNLRKDGNKVLIDGIKFAVKENPLAVLAKNLMKGGFVTGVSIETIGEDPDDTLTWKNHALCGLSVVAHPNNKHAYAVVSNSIAEARSNGLETEELEEIGNQFGERMNYVSNSLDSILSRYQQNSRSSKLDDILVALNGGKGSGNFGHAGRPGQVGGSAPKGGGSGGSSKGSETKKSDKKTTKKSTKKETKSERIDRQVKEIIQTTVRLMEKPASDSKKLSKEIRQDLKELDPTGEYSRPKTKGGNDNYNTMVSITNRITTKLSRIQKLCENPGDDFGRKIEYLTNYISTDAEICWYQAQHFYEDTGKGKNLKKKYENLKKELEKVQKLGKASGARIRDVYMSGVEIVFT